MASRQSLDPRAGSSRASRRRSRDSDSATAGRSGAATATVLEEETEDDLADTARPEHDSPAARPAERVLSILNRVGSSPDLPLHNAWSSVVYSSSKRRQLLKPTNGNGASPQLAALQRRRLIPLPIDLRTGTLKRDAIADVGGRLNGSVSMSALPEPHGSSDAAGMSEDDRMNYEITVASLKQRITVLEKELAATSKRSVKLERQLTATTKENQDLHGANAVLRAKTEELERAVMQQRHAFDKLAERYATAYANMERLAETASSSDVSSTLNVVVQTLSRENVELQRKVRVLEARHKTSAPPLLAPAPPLALAPGRRLVWARPPPRAR
ncbi:hypothetical protein ATCC90586_000046 [Pythium insidiosum]|nr:hypothetical protein ATCC90586_000046 [Pythium insidiosum]